MNPDDVVVQAAQRDWNKLNPVVWNGAGPDSKLTVSRQFQVVFEWRRKQGSFRAQRCCFVVGAEKIRHHFITLRSVAALHYNDGEDGVFFRDMEYGALKQFIGQNLRPKVVLYFVSP